MADHTSTTGQNRIYPQVPPSSQQQQPSAGQNDSGNVQRYSGPVTIQHGSTVVTMQQQVPTLVQGDRGLDSDHYKVGLCNCCL